MGRWIRYFFIINLTIILFNSLALAPQAPALAQMSSIAGTAIAPGPSNVPDWENLSVEDRRAMLSRLSDEQVRDIIVGQLNRTADAQQAQDLGSSMIGGFEAKAHVIRENLGQLLSKTDQIPSAFVFAHAKLAEGRSPWHPLLVIGGMIVMIGVGCLTEWAFRRWAQPMRLRFEQASPQRFCGKVGYLSLRIVLDIVAVGVFAFAAIATFFFLYQGHEPSRLLVTAYFSAVLIVRATSIVSRFLIAPGAPCAHHLGQ